MNNCFLFWGKFTELAKLLGEVLITIVSTVLVFLTPCYILACKCYKLIPIQCKVVKQEFLDAKAKKIAKKNE